MSDELKKMIAELDACMNLCRRDHHNTALLDIEEAEKLIALARLACEARENMEACPECAAELALSTVEKSKLVRWSNKFDAIASPQKKESQKNKERDNSVDDLLSVDDPCFDQKKEEKGNQ